MMLYNQYQRRRMYTRIALGKSSAMDVVAGESSGTSGQLKLLYPLLFLTQAYELYVGAWIAYAHYPSLLSTQGWLEFENRAEVRIGGWGWAG